MRSDNNFIVILGHTAGGKTSVATYLAAKINGEIISADSRQVYRKMDIGTGKDLADYTINGKNIPYHLIDIKDAGYKYNVFEYQQDFLKVYNELKKRNVIPVLCGGTGMYIEAVLKGYKLIKVPVNNELRKKIEQKQLPELVKILSNYKQQHNISDIDTKKRAIRAIEIAEYYFKNQQIDFSYPKINPLIIGINFDRITRRKRITERLKQRLNEGMINEVENLLNSGLSADDLIYYGLEYKFVTEYLTGKITYDEMFSGLKTAIHQFAKRQMTWFRRMERNGFTINWIDGNLPMDIKIEKILNLFKNHISNNKN